MRIMEYGYFKAAFRRKAGRVRTFFMHLESGIISYRENRSKNFKKNKTMNISFFGLGYVGCVGMGCLAQNGHKVIGIDISSEKIKK